MSSAAIITAGMTGDGAAPAGMSAIMARGSGAPGGAVRRGGTAGCGAAVRPITAVRTDIRAQASARLSAILPGEFMAAATRPEAPMAVLQEPTAAVLPEAAIAVVLPEPMAAVLPEEPLAAAVLPEEAMAVVLHEEAMAAVLPEELLAAAVRAEPLAAAVPREEALPSAMLEEATAAAMGGMRAVFAKRRFAPPRLVVSR
jgi:hypothetical protein